MPNTLTTLRANLAMRREDTRIAQDAHERFRSGITQRWAASCLAREQEAREALEAFVAEHPVFAPLSEDSRAFIAKQAAEAS